VGQVKGHSHSSWERLRDKEEVTGMMLLRFFKHISLCDSSRRRLFLLCLLLAILTSACAHPIHKEFDVYLTDHPTSLERVNKEASYTIDEDTKKMSYEFRSFTTGVANVWIVNVGEMLQDYVNVVLTYSFQRLVEDSAAGSLPINFYFKVYSYRFEDFQAKVEMDIIVRREDVIILEKRYSAQGKGQSGKMFWGGAFAQRHAVHQSTHLAFNDIFTQFIDDLKQKIRD